MICPAGPSDAEAIAALHAVLFDEGWRPGDIASLLAAHSGAAFLATELTAPTGFIIGRVAAGEAEILSLGVDLARRRQGIAGALVSAMLAASRERGARSVFLEVATDNAAAISLYRRLGFTTIGNRRGYYHRPGNIAIDAACMAFDL